MRFHHRFPFSLLAGLVLAVALCSLATPVAKADLVVCNQTKNPAGVAVAFKAETIWKSEGWWTVTPGQCETVLSGALSKNAYFLHAVHFNVGGRWEGNEIFCVNHGSFSIDGRMDCLDRGYLEAGFAEIDTKGKAHWKHTLIDDTDAETANSPASTVDPETHSGD